MANELRKRLSDDLLEAALEEQLEIDEETHSYPNAKGMAHIFSDEHNKKMERIFRMARKVERRPQRIRRYKQLAAGILIFFIASTVTVSQVEAFRLPVLNFFADVQQNFTLFHAQEQEVRFLTKNHREFEPHYMPEGFAVEEVEETPNDFFVLFRNESTDGFYFFAYKHITTNAALDTENSTVTDIELNGNKAVMIQKDEEIQISMYKDNNQYQIHGNISANEAKKVMESIK